MKAPWQWTAAVIAVAAAGTAGFVARRLLEDRSPASIPPPPSMTSDTSSRAPRTPQRMPDVTLPDLEGRPRQLSEWAGRPLIVNFWATWCEPCRREIPLLEKLRQSHAASRLEVLGIALDFRDDVAAYAKAAGIRYPILVAEQDGMTAQLFGVGMALPTSVFVDAEGRIVASHVGELREKDAERLLGSSANVP
jgi:thiol-disulfide isomerase/thioredoxin